MKRTSKRRNLQEHSSPLLEELESRLLMATFTVTSIADSGAGSLRSAIASANSSINAAGVLDRITFAIPGAGPHTIALTASLPTITDPVEIDGYSQSGAIKNTNGTSGAFNGVLQIVLDGAATPAGTSGLVIDAGNSEIKGLVISRFPASGIRITSNSGNTVAGNFIGTDVTGTIDRGNGGDGIQISDVRDNRIGGLNPEHRNVIAGNGSDGIEIRGVGSTSNVVAGNFIGVDKTGAAALGNSSDGVSLALGAKNNRIGGQTPGERNVISGNSSDGVEIDGATTSGNLIVGNYIGADKSGTLDRGNLVNGISITSAPSNTIGGETAGHRNVISGNNDNGIDIAGLAADNNIIRGNYIGTDAAGNVDLGNGSDGISVLDGGGTIIGGVGAGARNVVGGNGSDGIKVGGAGASGTTIQNNSIGVGANSVAAVGNHGHGIRLFDGVFSAVIGGIAVGTGNRIGFSGLAGVALGATAGNGNSIRGNEILASSGLAIDLGANGPTANDPAPDADAGPNRLQNAPVLATAVRGNNLILTGRIDSVPNAAFRVEIYANEAAFGAGNFGQMQHLLTTLTVNTNAAGHGDFVATLPNPAFGAGGDRLTATATHIFNNDTSEVSAPIAIAVDNTAPAASLVSAPNVGAAGGASYDFVVNYSDVGIVSRGSFNTGDVRVTGPGLNQLAVFVSASSAVDATSINVTYRLTPPGGSWDGPDNGTYTISLEPSQIRDIFGNANPAGQLGTFNVAVAISTLSITAMDAAAAETVAGAAVNTATFRINRGSATGPLSVRLARSGTATFGPTGDYTLSVNGVALAGLVAVIPDGEGNVDLIATPNDDALAEIPETITLTLVKDRSYALDPIVANQSATAMLTDNEPLVTIAALDNEAAETGLGDASDTGVFRISRTGDTSAPLTVNVSRSGNAKFGATGDYQLNVGGAALTASPRTVVIPADAGHVDVVVSPLDDAGVETTEMVTLALGANRFYSLDPVVLNRKAVVNILDNEPTVTIEAIDVTAIEFAADETADPGLFRISRTGNTAAPLTVKFFRKGTATHGAAGDYTLTAGGVILTATTVVIPAGQDHADVIVSAVDNLLVEKAETVILGLAASTTYKLDPVVANRSKTATILDSEATVSVSVVDATASETTTGETADPATIRISRTGSTFHPLTVKFKRTGTATHGATRDYFYTVNGVALTATSVVVPAGEDHVDLVLSPVDNPLVEPAETAIVTLAASTAYNLNPVPTNRTGTVSILDNEPLVTIDAIDASAAETATGETADTGTIRISRTGSTTNALTVKFARTGTATHGTTADYTMTVGGIALTITTIVIPAGQDHIDLVLLPIDNTAEELTETAIITLAASTAYNLDPVTANRAAAISILDND